MIKANWAGIDTLGTPFVSVMFVIGILLGDRQRFVTKRNRMTVTWIALRQSVSKSLQPFWLLKSTNLQKKYENFFSLNLTPHTAVLLPQKSFKLLITQPFLLLNASLWNYGVNFILRCSFGYVFLESEYIGVRVSSRGRLQLFSESNTPLQRYFCM